MSVVAVVGLLLVDLLLIVMVPWEVDDLDMVVVQMVVGVGSYLCTAGKVGMSMM